MNKEVLDYVINEANALIAAPSACKEVKDATQSWLSSLGTEREKEETVRFLNEVEEDIEPIDGLLAFASSPVAEKVFGKEGAVKFLEHAKELKASGAKYCDCPACKACENILSKKDELLA